MKIDIWKNWKAKFIPKETVGERYLRLDKLNFNDLSDDDQYFLMKCKGNIK